MLKKFSALLMLAGIAITIFAVPSGATTNTNDPDYWGNLYSADCVKHEPDAVTPHGHLNGAKTGVVPDVVSQVLIVKGGSVEGGNAVYEAPVVGSTYLAPLNNGGQQSAVSHWIICFPKTTTTTTSSTTIKPTTTTTTIPVTTTTTTIPRTTTTTSSTTTSSTTTVKPTTTTSSIPVVTVTEPPAQISTAETVTDNQLAYTGFNTWKFVLLGILLVVIGSIIAKKKS